MKKLIKKGQKGITIGGKPLYGYYYSSAKATPGKVNENGFQELAELEVYRPDFYNDISQHAPWLWNFITYPELDPKYTAKNVNKKVLEQETQRMIEETQRKKRNLTATWNAAGRPVLVHTKHIPHYDPVFNSINLKDLKDRDTFIAELAHPIEQQYFPFVDNWKQRINNALTAADRMTRYAQDYVGIPDDKKWRPSLTSSHYNSNYKFGEYSREARTHQIIQPILAEFLNSHKDLSELSTSEKFLLYDNLRQQNDFLESKFRNLSWDGHYANELAKTLADKLKEERNK